MTLSSNDKDKVKRVIPKGSNKVLDAAVARLYVAYPDANSWTYTGLSGAVVLCDDLIGNTFFLKLVDINGNRGVLWDQELWCGFEYNQDRSFFHTFEMEECYAGLLFDDVSDAQHFYKRVLSKEKHGSKKTVQNRNAIALKKAPETRAPGPRGENIASSDQRARKTTNVLYYDDLPPPEWRSLYKELENAGITEDMIADNKEFIKDYINQQGGPLVGLEPPIPRKYQHGTFMHAHSSSQAPEDDSSISSAAGSIRKKAPPPPPPPAATPADPASSTRSSSNSISSTPEPEAPRPAHQVPPPLAHPVPPPLTHQVPPPLPAESRQTPPALPSASRQAPPALPAGNRPVPPALPTGNRPAPPALPTSNRPVPPARGAPPALPTGSRPVPPPPPARNRPVPTPPPKRSNGPPPAPPSRRQVPAPPPSRAAVPVPQAPQPVQPAYSQPVYDRPAYSEPAQQNIPPPPPLPQVSQTPQAQQNIPPPPPLPQDSASAQNTAAGAPPPPPLPNFNQPQAQAAAAAPPPPPMPDFNQPAAQTSAPVPALPSGGGADRDALLSSIRGAGIGSLRKVDKSQLDRPSVILQESQGGKSTSTAGASSAAPIGGSGSLADALAAALNNRKAKVSKSDDESDNDDW